jgi:hypothetical protein
MKPTNGTVQVDGRPFATHRLEPVDEPLKFYGATHVLRIRPALDRQSEPGWFEQYPLVRAAIHDHLGRQN